MTSGVIPPKGPPTGDSSSADESPQAEESPKPPAGERRRGRPGGVVVSFVIAGTLLVLGFSPVSRLAVHGLPRAPGSLAPVVTGAQHGNATAVRAVPVGLPDRARIRTAADVFPYALAALGRPGALALMALLNSKHSLAKSVVRTDYGEVKYPYRYRPLEAVLDKAPPASFSSGATALGAALTVLAAQPQPRNTPRLAKMAIINASPAAYGVLNRARATGECAPQLDLLLLLTSALIYSQGFISQEEQRTETACPHDPTPGWLVGQSQLGTSDSAASTATFSRLAARHPRNTGVLTGLGDSYLLAGTSLMSSKPFTARQDFRLAITEYNHASALGDERDAAPGMARALIDLGEPAAAARLLSPLARSSGFPGQLLELLITADEAAHDYGAAVAAAQRLGRFGSASYPDGDALIPVPLSGSVDSLDDATLPSSFGADRLTPLTAELIPPGEGGGGAQTHDLSFIPGYRDDYGVKSRLAVPRGRTRRRRGPGRR